jgi:hypothetical protein
VKERAILFATPMVRSILAGTKTETRRLVKPQPEGTVTRPCPYGEPGDRLWVREAWAMTEGGVLYRADATLEGLEERPKVRWRPSLHMPRALCRLVLEVTSVRPERLSAMDATGALAEGRESVEAFKDSWNARYGEAGDGWSADPWVWVIGFKVIERR